MDFKCPICEKVIPSVSSTDDGKCRINAAHFPFCSERCRLIDLGGWLDGDYRVSSGVQEADAES
ncbi:MAG: DNA gyrase inhibitor YacG [Planctomycetes bacterium]|nr:DNA gyrase inhibitor YacG [Planctomycetota bacterium]